MNLKQQETPCGTGGRRSVGAASNPSNPWLGQSLALQGTQMVEPLDTITAEIMELLREVHS